MIITPPPAVAGSADHISVALTNSVVTLPTGQRIDEIESPEEATEWLRRRSLIPDHIALLEYCQNHLSTLRESLRSVFASHVEKEAPSQWHLDCINRALTAVPSAPVLHYDKREGLHRSPQHPVTELVEYAMAQVAEDSAALLTGDTASQLARCEAAPCDRFYLRTHARRQWCSTRCGDRVRAARAYARKRSQS